MQVYIVSTQSVEQNRDGVILKVHVTVHGVFSSLVRAQSIADKYGGQVNDLYLDKEYDAKKIQTWLNPGYKN